MTRPRQQSFDVFLAHDPVDGALAGAVIERFQNEGVTAFSPHLATARSLDLLSEPVRRELQDSFTFVVLLTPTFMKSDFLPFQVGAAAVHGAPIYVLRSGVTEDQEPRYLIHYKSEELWDGLPAVVREVKKESQPLSQSEYETLTSVYQEIGVPIDELMLDAADRAEVARLFRQKSRKSIPEGRLLRELMRLRKSGKLPRLATRSAS